MVPNNVVPQGAYLIYRKTNWNEFIIISHITPQLSFEVPLEATKTLTNLFKVFIRDQVSLFRKGWFYMVHISNQINIKVILTPFVF